jgi:5-methylcytosine-specific restriction endonuclease McrA
MLNPDHLYPPSTWCQLKCIRDKEDCMFTNQCGYRKRFITTIANRQKTAIHRYVEINGAGLPSGKHYVSMQDLIDLARVYLKTGFKCWYCGEPMVIARDCGYLSNALTLDHRVSLSCGGTNHISNFVFCCMECNMRKGKGTYPQRFDAGFYVRRMNREWNGRGEGNGTFA